MWKISLSSLLQYKENKYERMKVKTAGTSIGVAHCFHYKLLLVICGLLLIQEPGGQWCRYCVFESKLLLLLLQLCTPL